MRRLVPLAVLAIACTSTSAEVQDTDVVEVSPALGTPPPVPRHGWVRVEGVVESTRITSSGGVVPSVLDQIALDPHGGAHTRMVCFGPDDRFRERFRRDLPPDAPVYAWLADIGPGTRCQAPAWCRWASARILAGDTQLIDGVTYCLGPGITRVFAEDGPASPEQRATRMASLWSPAVPTDAEVVDILVGWTAEGLDRNLAITLWDSWPALDQAGVVDELVKAHDVTIDRTARRNLAQAAGLFADPRAQKIHRASCLSSEPYSCGFYGRDPVEITAEALAARGDAIGSFDLRREVAARLVDGVEREALSDALVACAGLPGHDPTPCLQALDVFAPERIVEAAKVAARRSDVRMPKVQRALALRVKVGDDPVTRPLVDVGLLPADAVVGPLSRMVDPVVVLQHGGRAISDDPDLHPVDRLRVLAGLFGLRRAALSLTTEVPATARCIVNGRAHTGLVDRPEDVRDLVAFVNAVARAEGLEDRLLAQPVDEPLSATTVVVGPPSALEAGIRAGLLSAPAPAPRDWPSTRAAPETLDPAEDTGTW